MIGKGFHWRVLKKRLGGGGGGASHAIVEGTSLRAEERGEN